MKHRFIHGWVAQQQKAYHQRTRGIMTPEERKELEAEATKAMAEIERKAAEKAWWEACLRIADGENNLDIADTYQKQSPYLGRREQCVAS